MHSVVLSGDGRLFLLVKGMNFMMYPAIEETKEYLKSYGTVPLFYELLTDSFTPVRMFAILKENYDNCFILESVDNSNAG